MVLCCLLPQIHSTDKPEELQKKHPVRSPTFSKLPPPYFIFSLNADIAVRKMVRLETGVSSYYKCIRFFTDAIISYSMQKSIVGILNIYTLPEYRKKGYGKQITEKLIEHSKEIGIKKLWLNASEEGKKIYLKLGFKEKNNEMEIFI